MKTWKIAGINFDHAHMGDNLRMAHEHPHAEIVAICDQDPRRMKTAAENFAIPPERLFTDYRVCLERTRPDIVLLCPATAEHGTWARNVIPFNTHVLLEKPFASSLAEADDIIEAAKESDKILAINWPLAWVAAHRTTKRLIDEDAIGDVTEVHYYDGNRGPLWHVADKMETTPEQVAAEKSKSWFYKKESGGGSLLDYLGYGVTLGTWFRNNEVPIEVTTVVDQPPALEVDEHSITVARYPGGLSKFETRWGTFTDPWTHQPQPKCGFIIRGTRGTISSFDYEPAIRIQTARHPEAREQPVDRLEPPLQNPVQYLIHCLETGTAVEGPLSVEVSRIGQRIVEAAIHSAAEKRTVPLPD